MHSLSVASIDVPLNAGDARRLGSNIAELGGAFYKDGKSRSWVPSDISDIRTRVAEAVASMPNGAFVRLGSRSPKDSWEAHRRGSLKTTAKDDPLEFILDCSERIYEDLSLAIQHEYAPHIWVRQWVDIPRWAEFRCFMKDRRLVGISQYNYLEGEEFPEIIQNHGTIRWVIEEQFFPSFRDASHLDSVVFDVFLKTWTARDNTRVWESKLLEVNPFFVLTDPCLFGWNEPFGGEFRFNSKLTKF